MICGRDRKANITRSEFKVFSSFSFSGMDPEIGREDFVPISQAAQRPKADGIRVEISPTVLVKLLAISNSVKSLPFVRHGEFAKRHLDSYLTKGL